MIEDDEFADSGDFRAASGEHAAVGQVTDDAVERVIAAQEAAILEVQDVGGSGEGDSIRSTTREFEHRGGSAAARERGGRVQHGHELRVLVAAEIAVVGAEAALPHHAHTVDRIIGGVVVPVRDRPGTEDAIGLGSETGVEDDAGSITRLADVAAGEVDGGAGGAGERREAEEGGDEVSAAVVGGEGIAALRNGQGAEAFADVFAGDTRIDQDAAAHADGGAVADAVVIDPLDGAVGIDRERRVVQDQLGGIEERAIISERVGAAEESGDAAMAERAGHGERKAADSSEINAYTGGRAMEISVSSVQIRHERTVARRARDEATAVGFSAILEIAHELGEAVEVERTAVRVQEILLSGAIDGIVEAQSDGAVRDIGPAAVVLAIVEQQDSRAHLHEIRSRDDLAGQVDGHAVHDLEGAGVRRGDGTEFKSGDRQRVGDGRRTGGASEEEVAGGEAERGERGPGDVARVRIGHGERVQGRTHRGEIVARRGRGDLGGRGRDEGGIGEGAGGGVIREGDDRGAGQRLGRE